jgi:hypothetical protein
VSTGFCENHSFEVSEDDCGNCGRSFCSECLVYPFGRKRPPLCKACAIAAAGIRKNGGRAPVASRRELKRQQRERRRMRREQSSIRPEPASPMTAAMQWVPGEPQEPEPHVAEPTPDEEPAYAGGSGVGAGVAAGLGFSVDEQELQEIRPSFDGRLTRSRR